MQWSQLSDCFSKVPRNRVQNQCFPRIHFNVLKSSYFYGTFYFWKKEKRRTIRMARVRRIYRCFFYRSEIHGFMALGVLARCRGEKITFSFAIFRAFLQEPFLRSPANALTRHYRRPDWMFVRGVNARSFAIFREFSPKPHCFCTSMIPERRGRLQTTSDSPRNRSNRPLTDSGEHRQKQFRSFRTFPSHFYRVSNKSRYAHGFR